MKAKNEIVINYFDFWRQKFKGNFWRENSNDFDFRRLVWNFLGKNHVNIDILLLWILKPKNNFSFFGAKIHVFLKAQNISYLYWFPDFNHFLTSSRGTGMASEEMLTSKSIPIDSHIFIMRFPYAPFAKIRT